MPVEVALNGIDYLHGDDNGTQPLTFRYEGARAPQLVEARFDASAAGHSVAVK